jgi:hypothetical protein
MKTLEDFKTMALADVRSPELGERLIHLFHNFTLSEAREIVERTNRFRAIMLRSKRARWAQRSSLPRCITTSASSTVVGSSIFSTSIGAPWH